MQKKIMVLGGDGFCGWPTSLHLAALGCEVLIVDNLIRRTISEKLSAPSLTPIQSIGQRMEAARKIGNLKFFHCDIAIEAERFKELLSQFQPDTVVHFAEQRSAPYSMLGDRERKYTVNNNITGTNNLLSNIVELKLHSHVVHLGTMGVYGYDDKFGEIPEGYLDVKIESTGEKTTIPYPPHPGSIYHLTKCLDHVIMQFYAQNWGLRITDLHQGIVWGTDNEYTKSDPALINRFDYDGEYGTVLNRMLCQSQIGHPLTVYGTGGQKRAFIHISDTSRCIALACDNPPEGGSKVQVYNQVSEIYRVRDLAEMISKDTSVDVSYIENPRKELAENELLVSNTGLRSLGFEPISLGQHLLLEIEETAQKYKDRINESVIYSKAKW